MRQLSDTRGIFQQLAATDGDQGVRVVVENHDAWVNSDSVDDTLTLVVRSQFARTMTASVEIIVSNQRQRLDRVVTRLPSRIARAV